MPAIRPDADDARTGPGAGGSRWSGRRRSPAWRCTPSPPRAMATATVATTRIQSTCCSDVGQRHRPAWPRCDGSWAARPPGRRRGRSGPVGRRSSGARRPAPGWRGPSPAPPAGASGRGARRTPPGRPGPRRHHRTRPRPRAARRPRTRGCWPGITGPKPMKQAKSPWPSTWAVPVLPAIGKPPEVEALEGRGGGAAAAGHAEQAGHHRVPPLPGDARPCPSCVGRGGADRPRVALAGRLPVDVPLALGTDLGMGLPGLVADGGAVEGAAVGDGGVHVGQLHRGDAEVTLADRHVDRVARRPVAVGERFGVLLVEIGDDLGREGEALPLGREVDARSRW